MRAICASHAICPAGREGIYIISHLPLGKYIAFSVRKKYRIAEQYIAKELPEKEFFNPLLRVVLSYTVTSRKFVCQIPISLLKTVLGKPAHSDGSFCSAPLAVGHALPSVPLGGGFLRSKKTEG